MKVGGLADTLESLGKCLADVGDNHGATAGRSEAGLSWSQSASDTKPFGNENPWHNIYIN